MVLMAVVLAGVQMAGAQVKPDSGIPSLHKQGTTTQLLVDGKPFVILGGELHNSSASSLAYMEPIWPKMVALNLNTVLAVVSWELLEPEEGKFDFALVDGSARRGSPAQPAAGAPVVRQLEERRIQLRPRAG